MMDYKKDGEFCFERSSTMLKDTCSFLSNISGVTYHPSGKNVSLVNLLQGKDRAESEEEVDELGSYLLKNMSKMHSVLCEYNVHGGDEEFVLYRLDKLAGKVSKLSDQYQTKNRYYGI